MNAQITLLLVASIICGISYIYIFVNSIRTILTLFSKNTNLETDYWWTLIINGFFGFIAYCAIFVISLYIKGIKISDFIKNTNDKVFSFLLAAFIAQFLSSLFNRQQFEYQTQLAENKAKADKIENLIMSFEKSLSARVSSMITLMQVFEKLIELKGTRTKKHYSEIEKATKGSAERKVEQFNEELNNWHSQMQVICTALMSLDLLPLRTYLDLYINQFCLQRMHEHIKYDDKLKLAEARKSLNNIAPYHDVIINVLQILANVTRGGKTISCPSLEILKSFTKIDSNNIVTLKKDKVREWIKESIS